MEKEIIFSIVLFEIVCFFCGIIGEESWKWGREKREDSKEMSIEREVGVRFLVLDGGGGWVDVGVWKCFLSMENYGIGYFFL